LINDTNPTVKFNKIEHKFRVKTGLTVEIIDAVYILNNTCDTAYYVFLKEVLPKRIDRKKYKEVIKNIKKSYNSKEITLTNTIELYEFKDYESVYSLLPNPNKSLFK
jgi:hypothetical protein